MSFAMIEEGLKNFCARWTKNSSQVMSFRSEAILNKNLLLRIENGPSYTLRIQPQKAKLTLGEAESVNATVTMSKEDWAAVLAGEYNIDGVAFAGRCPYPRHERRLIRQLGIIIQTTLLLEGQGE
jgi:putative sterol carrier protein